jgi:hypothetical protein
MAVLTQLLPNMGTVIAIIQGSVRIQIDSGRALACIEDAVLITSRMCHFL